MYTNGKTTFSEARAKEIEERNEKIWNDFWSIPSSERKSSDWSKLLDIEIMVKV